jgi:hypothetical protein
MEIIGAVQASLLSEESTRGMMLGMLQEIMPVKEECNSKAVYFAATSVSIDGSRRVLL